MKLLPWSSKHSDNNTHTHTFNSFILRGFFLQAKLLKKRGLAKWLYFMRRIDEKEISRNDPSPLIKHNQTQTENRDERFHFFLFHHTFIK